jgi:signal transduction histidine kinase/CheY-like chemotaxis protein
MQISRRPRSILFWLGWLVILGVLPAWVATGLTIAGSYHRERAALVKGTSGTARVLVRVVERDLASATAALQGLAVSPDLVSGNTSAFRDQARKLLLTQAGGSIELVDATGQQIMSTIEPNGEPLPHTDVPDLLRTVFESKKPAISDFYVGGTSGLPRVAAAIPVLRDGEVIYALTMTILAERLADILRSQHLSPDWIVSILDSKGTIVARTRGARQFVGQKGSPALLDQLSKASEGVFATVSKEGIPALSSFSRSEVSGWAVGIAIPTAGLTAKLEKRLWLTIAGAAIAFLFALFLARYISLRIARSIQALSGPALALASDVPIVVPQVEIREVDEVGRALTKARHLLEERTIARDQAERAERDMAVAKEAAEESNLAKSQFITLMSHELRTPLNGILGFSQIINGQFYGQINAKQKEFVDAILSSGNHLLGLINDILDLSKIEIGQMTISMEQVDLVPVIKSVAANLERLAEKEGVNFEAGDFGLGLPPVLADQVRLAQCLFNIGSNAIKYNRPNGSVAFSYAVHSDRLRISVSDTGIGIPKDRQAELFQPFNRLGAERKAVEGTGVGLALTRRLVELMDGQIGFVSTLGEGSCFWIDIPIFVGSPHELHPTAPIGPEASQNSGFSVLYVEDNPSNLVLMRNLLGTMQSVRLIEATNGALGLAMAKDQHPDLILLDIDLPDIDGMTLLKQLKDLPEFATTPILALSANVMARDVKRGKEAGFFEYVTKPIDVNRFFEILDTALLSARRYQTFDPAPQPNARCGMNRIIS